MWTIPTRWVWRCEGIFVYSVSFHYHHFNFFLPVMGCSFCNSIHTSFHFSCAWGPLAWTLSPTNTIFTFSAARIPYYSGVVRKELISRTSHHECFFKPASWGFSLYLCISQSLELHAQLSLPCPTLTAIIHPPESTIRKWPKHHPSLWKRLPGYIMDLLNVEVIKGSKWTE